MKRILVAEDDKFLASAYKVKLKKANYDVKVVFDGNEFLKELPQFQPDLVILDLVMPEKDGFSVLKDLKNLEEYKDIPIIVASNLGQSDDIVKATQLGANDYIIKTDLSMKKLIEKIKEMLPETSG